MVGEHVGMQCGHDGDEELQRQRHRLQPRNNTTHRQLRMSRDKITVRAGGRGVANFEFGFRDGFNDEAPAGQRHATAAAAAPPRTPVRARAAASAARQKARAKRASGGGRCAPPVVRIVKKCAAAPLRQLLNQRPLLILVYLHVGAPCTQSHSFTAKVRHWSLQAPHPECPHTRATTRQQRDGFGGTLWVQHR